MRLNKVINKYVAYNKQIERRMESSSGGAVSAILETLAKDDYYFCGAVFDDGLKVRHVLTNDPLFISRISGYKPVASEYKQVFPEIKELLADQKRVVFIGTPAQCNELLEYVHTHDNLILVDIINSPFIAQELLDKYIKEKTALYNSEVESIRFYDKEFPYEYSKRITLKNGRTYFTHSEEPFDRLLMSGEFTPDDPSREAFKSLDERVGDITIGSYKQESPNDGMGYAYISANSEAGIELMNKSRKRLVMVSEGDSIDSKRVRYQSGRMNKSINVQSLNDKSLQELSPSKKTGFKSSRLYHYIKSLFLGAKFAQWNPLTFLRFVKLNYFTKGIHTDCYSDGFFYIAPKCALKLVNGFEIELHGPLKMGTRRIKESKQETRLRMERGSRIIVHEHCSFGAGSNVEIYKNALLEVGDLQSNAELTITCGERISLGSPVNMARNSSIRDTNGHIMAIPGYKMTRPVIIGNHTWLCDGCTIMPGVTVGDGAIVGASSFVTKKVAPFTMVQGFPAVEVGGIRYFRI